MCTICLTVLAVKKVMLPETYVPFFVAMAFDCGIAYWIAVGIAGRHL